MTATISDIHDIIRLAKEAKELEDEWRTAVRETFPEGSPIKFALKTSDVISIHEGTASKHQMGEACDQVIVNVDPESIPERWKWKLSNGPCSCCNKSYFTVGLSNILFCMEK